MIYHTERSVPSTSVNFNQSSIDRKKNKRNRLGLKLTEIGEIAEQSIFFNKSSEVKANRVNRTCEEKYQRDQIEERKYRRTCKDFLMRDYFYFNAMLLTFLAFLDTLSKY